MLEQICAFIHNYFVHDRHSGTFTISNGSITLPFLVVGQYFRICGSRFNDGVYTYPADELTDETFSGVIWDMRPPRSFLALVSDIEAWNEKYGETANSPYSSESFGGYSYTKSQGYASSDESVLSSWQSIYKPRLNEWRKLA